MRYCKNCGLLQTPDAVQCPQCGAALPPEPAVPVSTKAPHYTASPACAEAPSSTLGFGATLGALLLFAIPVVGFVLTLVWGFGGTRSVARQTLARAYLVRTLIVAVLFSALMLVFAFAAYFISSPIRTYY